MAEASASRSEASVKEKSKSNSPEAEELVGGGGGGGGAPASAASKWGKIAVYVAIVALVFCLIAFALSCYLIVLWWYWPLVLTVPALAVALVALFFAPLCPGKKMPLFQPGHHEISLGFGAIGILFGLAGLIWCCVEIAWVHSYQGVVGGGGGGGGDRQKRNKQNSVGSSYEAGFTCRGQAFDWSYRSKALVMEHDCLVKDAKLKKEMQTKAGDLLNNAIKGKNPLSPRVRRSCCDGGNSGWPSYKGVDSYEASPVFETHKIIVAKNKVTYMSTSLQNDAAKAAMTTACTAFDTNIGKFFEARKKCDKALKKMEPKCEKNKGGTGYTYKLTKYDAAKVAKKCATMLSESKYYKALQYQERDKIDRDIDDIKSGRSPENNPETFPGGKKPFETFPGGKDVFGKKKIR